MDGEWAAPLRDRIENDVTRDNDAKRETGEDRERRGDAQLALDDLPARLVHRILTAASDRANETVLIGIAKLRPDAKKSRDVRSLEHLDPMIIGTVGESRNAGGIGARQPLGHYRSTTRQYQAGPRPPAHSRVGKKRDR